MIGAILRTGLVAVAATLLMYWSVSAEENKTQLPKEITMEQWHAFEILAEITGPIYRVKRAELLKQNANRLKRLEAYQHDKDWRMVITAAILRGWMAHEELYATLSRNFRSEQLEKALPKVTGMSGIYEKYVLLAEEKQKVVLPFCWEALLKFSDEWQQWQTIAVIRMIGAVPDRRSVKPLLWFIRTTDQYQLADEAARALSRIDDEQTMQMVRAARDEHARLADLLDETLEKDEE